MRLKEILAERKRQAAALAMAQVNPQEENTIQEPNYTVVPFFTDNQADEEFGGLF